MGKAKKLKISATPKIPLEKQLENTETIKIKNKIRLRKDEDDKVVDSNLSHKILTAAIRQQQELEDNVGVSYDTTIKKKQVILGTNESEESDEDNDQPEDFYYENVEISEEDERALELFMSKNPIPRRTLGDIIKEKITEKPKDLQAQFSEFGDLQIEEIDPKIKQLYEGVRDVLQKYRSGKLPKAFKIVPNLRNWEQILFITDPASWSAAAMYQATRIFASNLKEKMAQRFFNLVLLPRVREHIAEYKRLNFHLYQALRKALFKPGGFMKGILLPLLESGDCTLREAIIIGSVITRNSIPMLHSSAAMLKIAEMDYTGANSILLRIFFDKKYALPYRVIDAVVSHFLRFERDTRELPVLWHQALLTFCQRYKSDVSSEQRDALLGLLRVQSHATITPEIRRELQNAKCRDIEIEIPKMIVD